jgi:hypothetical protein
MLWQASLGQPASSLARFNVSFPIVFEDLFSNGTIKNRIRASGKMLFLSYQQRVHEEHAASQTRSIKPVTAVDDSNTDPRTAPTMMGVPSKVVVVFPPAFVMFPRPQGTVSFGGLFGARDLASLPKLGFVYSVLWCMLAGFSPATQATHVPTPPISAPAVNTHALAATPPPPEAVAVVSQAAVFAVAAAQSVLAPPTLTAQVPTSKARSCATLVMYFPASHGVHVHERVAASHPALKVPSVQVVAVSHASRW